jgi:hypothetical protein
MVQKNNKINEIIKKLFDTFVDYKNIENQRPLSLNLSFTKDYEEVEIYEDTENLIKTDSYLFVTIYTPYNINNLRFYADEDNRKIVVRSYNYFFYKEIWFSNYISKNNIVSTYKNNILEIKIKLK